MGRVGQIKKQKIFTLKMREKERGRMENRKKV